MELEKIAFKGEYFKALKESRLIDDTRKYLSGRFKLDRFTMVQHVLMESLYSMSDLRNPSATSGAAWWLNKHWKEISRQAKNRQFAIVTQTQFALIGF